MIPRPLVALAIAAVCTLASPARADEQSDFEKGRAAYATKNYDDADRRFREMLETGGGTLHDPALVSEARMYWAATMFALSRQTDAAAMLEKLLIARPEYEPDPLRFPQNVINFFIDTRAKIVDKINAAKAAAAKAAQDAHDAEVAAKAKAAKRLAMLEAMASEEIEIQRHSRLFALLPFGAGQFQNGSPTLGWVLLATEGALALASAVTIPVYRIQLSNAAQAHADGQRDQEDGWIARANTTRYVNLALAGAFAVTWIAGVLQAELAFVPEITVQRTRPIPPVGLRTAPPLSVRPTVTPITLPAEGRVVGGVFGLAGSF